MMRLPLIVVAWAAAVLPAHSLAAEAAEFRGWVHGYGMMIGPGNMLDGLSAEKRRVNIQLIEQLHGKPLDAEGMRHYFSAPKILELDPEGPAARAGLKTSDMLTHIYENIDKYDSDTSRVRSPDEAFALMDRFRTGQTVTLDGLRNDKLVQFKVTVGVRRRVKDFRGVFPGETTAEELRANGEWGKPVRESQRGSGGARWEYKIAPWSKVFALIEDDVVRAMDFVPPPAISVERISKAVGLGELVPLKTLPPSARVGGGDIGAGQLLAAREIYALLVTDRPGERADVKLVRLYSPGSARAAAPARGQED